MPGPELSIFLKLDGIDGESTVKGHEKEIDVLSYAQGLEAAIVLSGGGGAAAGKTTFSGVRFRKAVDSASLLILIACASGQHIKEARFAFRRRGADFDFYAVTFQDVLISRVNEQAGTGDQYPLSFDALNAGASSAGLLDEITLIFARVLWEQRAMSPSGQVAVTAKGGWDVRANTRL